MAGTPNPNPGNSIHAIRGYCIEVMMHQGALLLAADQTLLAEHDLLPLTKSLVSVTFAPFTSAQIYLLTLLFVTGSAVVLHCVKAHRQSQWRSPNFNPL